MYFGCYRHPIDEEVFVNNYIRTHMRAGSWLIGAALGIIINNVAKNPPKLPKVNYLIPHNLYANCRFIMMYLYNYVFFFFSGLLFLDGHSLFLHLH